MAYGHTYREPFWRVPWNPYIYGYESVSSRTSANALELCRGAPSQFGFGSGHLLGVSFSDINHAAAPHLLICPPNVAVPRTVYVTTENDPPNATKELRVLSLRALRSYTSCGHHRGRSRQFQQTIPADAGVHNLSQGGATAGFWCGNIWELDLGAEKIEQMRHIDGGPWWLEGSGRAGHEKSKAGVCEARSARRAGVQENSLALIRPCEPIEGPAAEETAPARSDTGRDSIPVLCEQRPGRRRREERKEEA
ncbi:hypothetical protein B0H13DRAFT_1919865 [Mycena leptocephala]|nr:hypothetical protein B0H13DRAFT_1919865 [Mycena leptocephala]